MINYYDGDLADLIDIFEEGGCIVLDTTQLEQLAEELGYDF